VALCLKPQPGIWISPLPLSARRSGPLRGKVRVPGDKSISHRALIFGALAVGKTQITGLLEGEDVLHTADAMRALGARVERVVERAERRGAGAWDVHGVGVAGFREPREVLDFGNSATGCRLVMGAVAGCPITATFDGDASLRKRPMRRILDPVELMGAHTVHASEGGRLPITIAGARATPCPSSTARRSLRRTSNRPCARRPRCAGRDDRRRKRGKPRSHRTPARPFRRAHHVPAGTMAVVRSPDFLRVLNQRDCACNIDPPASSYAIMRTVATRGPRSSRLCR